ncbi:hypothetical protein [uncultured Oscillibacter sp.]|uniref:hypothetical protein n=1 Tax=uncultured Oscillibacter sp. TaxID=876091 RepID=UPI0025CC3F06|nr:hypothetical protein [uncultured Oscillibacter sp.]
MVVLLLAFATLKLTLGIFLPILVTFLIAAFLDGPLRFLSRKFPLKRTIAAIPVIIFFFGAAGLLFTFPGIRVLALSTGIFAGLPGLCASTLEPASWSLSNGWGSGSPPWIRRPRQR